MSNDDWMLSGHVYQQHSVESAPGEELFRMTRGSERLTCRVLYDGTYGVEAQFFLDGMLWIGHRFPTKELAVLWAKAERNQHRQNGWSDAD